MVLSCTIIPSAWRTQLLMLFLCMSNRLGPYELLASIGAGGMGEVYRARDSRLDRIVAVKMLNEQFSNRFEREARAVAALNHSNICQLYDVALGRGKLHKLPGYANLSKQ